MNTHPVPNISIACKTILTTGTKIGLKAALTTFKEIFSFDFGLKKQEAFLILNVDKNSTKQQIFENYRFKYCQNKKLSPYIASRIKAAYQILL